MVLRLGARLRTAVDTSDDGHRNMALTTSKERLVWIQAILDRIEEQALRHGFVKRAAKRTFQRKVVGGIQEYTLWGRSITVPGNRIALRIEPTLSVTFDCVDRVVRSILAQTPEMARFRPSEETLGCSKQRLRLLRLLTCSTKTMLKELPRHSSMIFCWSPFLCWIGSKP